jgi:transcriptional regulator with XRE-family HTH domain
MLIGKRLRALREEKKLSQGDVEKRTGLLRCYISRVENGHTVPAIETLEKCARALEIPMYQLFYDGAEPPKPPVLPKKSEHDMEWSLGRRCLLTSPVLPSACPHQRKRPGCTPPYGPEDGELR